MKFDTIGKKCGAGTAIIIFLGLVYQGFDYIAYTTSEAAGLEKKHDDDIAEVMVLAQSNAKILLLQRWQFLNAKAQNGKLTASEKLEYCLASRELGFEGIGCA